MVRYPPPYSRISALNGLMAMEQARSCVVEIVAVDALRQARMAFI